MTGPGRLSLELRHLWRKLTGRRARARAAAKRAFNAALARMNQGDIAVDLGANVGEFAAKMAATGAQVYAFEPDPHAYARLAAAMGNRPNVTLFNAAAGEKAGTARLYRATGFQGSPDRKSKSSSLFAEKTNVDAANAIEVEVVDLAAFLTGLDRDIALVKIDVEGAEVPLLETLLSHPVAARIGEIYVETHERKLPQLAARTEALKRQAARLRKPVVNWDWH